MAEQERQKEKLQQDEMSQKLYYDYEGRFIKQKLERERMDVLPRVVKPEMFAKGGHSLGDLRVFERYSAGPISSLTCSFLDVKAGERTELLRMIPAEIFYILEGGGVSVQDGKEYPFSAEDVVLVPPYTARKFLADSSAGFRAWSPQVRLWHGTGLLWQEQFEFQSVPDETEPIQDDTGQLLGFKVPRGVMGLERDLEVRTGAEEQRERIFKARRAVRKAPAGNTKYHWFLQRLVEENELEEKGPRVIRSTDRHWEDTQQGRMKFYITLWTEVAAAAMDLMVQEIEPGGHSGQHRHIFEELLLVAEGRGCDVHDGTRCPWEAGDLICIPPMTEHQHFNEGEIAVRLISTWPRYPADEFLGGIEQIGFASCWNI